MRSNSRPLPMTVVEYAAGMFSAAAAFCHLRQPVAQRIAGRDVRAQAHLRCRSRPSMRYAVMPSRSCTTLSSRTSPAFARRHVELRRRVGADVAVRVLQAASRRRTPRRVRRRGSATPRRRRPPSGAATSAMSAASTPRSAARSRSMITRSSGLFSRSVVSTSTSPGIFSAAARSFSLIVAQRLQVGPANRRSRCRKAPCPG